MPRNNMSPNKQKIDLFRVFSIVFLLACLLGMIYVFRARYRYTLTSDDSSELVLGNLLKTNGQHILSKDWYYSTEIRFLNINIPYSFFFNFTDSWHRVRVLATVSQYLLILAAYWGLSRVYHFERYFAITAALLFVPFSAVYYWCLVTGTQYLTYFVIMFVVILAAEWFLRLNGWKANLLLGLSFVFSILAGLGGARMILVTYIPLAAAAFLAFIDRKRGPEAVKWFRFAITVCTGGLIGFALNARVLPRIYSFYTWNDVAFTGLSFSRLGDLLTEFLVSFGYTEGSLMSFSLINNFISVAWVFLTICAVRYALRHRQETNGAYFRLAIFLCCVYTVYIAYYLFTDAYHHERYNLVFAVLSFPLTALYIEHFPWKQKASQALFIGLILLTALSGAHYAASMWNYDRNEEIRKIADFLVDNGYQNGYSTFWRANLVTEFSNGKLDIWSIAIDDYDIAFTEIDDIDRTYQWLQKIDHDTTHPEGKLFIFFTVGEFDNNCWKEHLSDEQVIYRSNQYVILGYKDYDTLVKTLYSEYDFVFGEEDAMENGVDIDGARYLKTDGVSYGAMKTYWPGNYMLTITGSGLTWTDINFSDIPLTPLVETDDILQYTFTLPEKNRDARVIIANTSADTETLVRLDSMRVDRLPEP